MMMMMMMMMMTGVTSSRWMVSRGEHFDGTGRQIMDIWMDARTLHYAFCQTWPE